VATCARRLNAQFVEAATQILDECRGVRGGILTISMPSEAKTASKVPVNLVSLVADQEAERTDPLPKSISRLRSAWVVQAAIGWAVTPSSNQAAVPSAEESDRQ
jgi:hypothetical protein